MSLQSSSVADGPQGAPSSDEASPPASKPRAHESIWKRSKKILGMGRFQFLQQTTSASKSSDKEVEGNGKNGTAGGAGVSKRREQVRRAQKTHRQRTEQYILALEQEILRLQKVEEESLKVKAHQKRQEDYIRALEKQISSLSATELALSPADLDLAVGSSDFESESDYFARITMSPANEDGSWSMSAEMTPQSLSGPKYVGNDPVAEEAHNQILAYWGSLNSINPLANCQGCTDFVLHLEFGCSAHLHKVGSDPEHVSGHTLTTSGRLIELAPQQPETTESWTASCLAVMKLFMLSANLPLENDEITPVQAWLGVWQHPEAHLVRQEDMEFLQTELRKVITCHGFGGVIDGGAFSTTLSAMFERIKTAQLA